MTQGSAGMIPDCPLRVCRCAHLKHPQHSPAHLTPSPDHERPLGVNYRTTDEGDQTAGVCLNTGWEGYFF